MKKTLVLALTMIGLSSCGSEDILSEEQQLAKDIDLIDNHIADNNIQNVVEHPSGIRYVVNEEGTGDIPDRDWIVKVQFQGLVMTDLNGLPFESNTQGIEYILSTRIEAWQIILTEQKVGADLTLYVPSGLAFGTNRFAGIPSNSNIVYDINLVSARP
jgi:FKBP-type peptidyl-prolyl cis-trans isomerase FkpA